MPASLSALDTKQQIIMAALKLFAENGVGPVSMRNVNREIGTKNNSAAHYHFGDKDKLVEAVLGFIQDWFEARREVPMQALEQRAQHETLSIDEILQVWAAPYFDILTLEPWGYDAVRLIARIQLEQDDAGNNAHFHVAQTILQRFKVLVLGCLPELPDAVVLQRLSYCIYSFVQGLAVTAHQMRDQRVARDGTYLALTRIALEFSIAGMKAPTSIHENSAEHRALSALHLLF